ncbi:MAG: hypothetical protein A3F68_09645 [Acidobacteria bacterium RIFCSPLOWO2_12_FULL_54_10]|nr:MAG: hypothetical protein A3F68_09645 [Acidobacteria bacterium RIFCSPLOWO2_12_FULL_54_10]
MSHFHDLPVTVSGRISYEDDFLFPKLKDELANKIRAKFREIHQEATVSFDTDGDIQVSSHQGTAYITQTYVLFVAKAEGSASLQHSNVIETVSKIIDEIHNFRTPLLVEQFVIRFFLSIKGFNASHEELEGYFPKNAKLIFDSPDKSYPDKVNFNWSANWSEHGGFFNKVDFSARSREVNLTYNRNSGFKEFTSFSHFLAAIDTKSILETMQRIIDPFISLNQTLFDQKSSN